MGWPVRAGVSSAVALAAMSVPSPARPSEPPAPDLTVQRLSEDVWLHGTGRAGDRANGLLVATREGSLLVNTTPTPTGTRALLSWAARELPQPVRLAIITAAEPERMGGLSALVEAHIPVHASERTARLARLAGLGWTDDHFGFESEARIRAGDYSLELFSPQSPDDGDDLLVWIPEAGVLFGGALVRDARSGALEPASPARLDRWARAVQRTRELSRGVRWVVPGQGDAGDAALLDHTLTLLRQAARR